jgi:hypothetical protein
MILKNLFYCIDIIRYMITDNVTNDDLSIREVAVWIVIFLIVIVLIYTVMQAIKMNPYNPHNKNTIENMVNVPDVSTRQPNVSTRQPNVSTRQPNVSTRQPNVSTRQPNVSTRQPKWFRTDNCKFKMNNTTHNALDESNVVKTLDHVNADLIFPCGYNNINDEIKSLPNVYYKDSVSDIRGVHSGPRRVFIIEGADEITAKNFLWKNLCNHHGLNRAKQLAPSTYLLTEPQKSIDLIRLEKEHWPGKMYIMKKNIQRQIGLAITSDLNKIKKNEERYMLAQELLQDSYLVNGRKINLRIYIVVVCHEANTDVYMFNDGFMYYTKQNFVKNLDCQDVQCNDNHITTGYVERDVYTLNPLTHNDFKQYLDLTENQKYHPANQPRKLYPQEVWIRGQGLKVSAVVFKRIEDLIQNVFISFKGYICRKFDDNKKPIPIYTDYSVQIFGADVAMNDQLQPQIIEINKGPDLSPKDERDGNVKKALVNDTLEVIGMRPITKNNGLIKVLEM